MNRIILTARLTNDVLIYQMQDGKRWAKLTIACDARSKNSETLFIVVKTFNDKIVDALSKYVAKGDLVGVDGVLTQKTFLDQNNNKKIAYEIVADSIEFLESLKMKKLKEEEERKNAIFNSEQKEQPIKEINDDDLPF